MRTTYWAVRIAIAMSVVVVLLQHTLNANFAYATAARSTSHVPESTARYGFQAQAPRQVGTARDVDSVDSAQQNDTNVIPDYVAYRHFISVTSASPTASDTQLYIRDAALARVGFSNPDTAAYLDAVSTVRSELDIIDHRIADRTTEPVYLDALKHEKGAILDSAAARVRLSLSADGATRLRQHIDAYVKPRIRIHVVK